MGVYKKNNFWYINIHKEKYPKGYINRGMEMVKKSSYNPMYFLAALGNGGLSVSFFMYLMFMVPHPDTPMVTFNHWYPYLVGDNKLVSILIALALIGIIYFAIRHFQRLIWNIKQFRHFKQTAEYEALKNSNGASSLMAVPLTLAMVINVLFVLGAAFVPNLWSVIEYLFPFALLGFLAVGIYALSLFLPIMTSYMTKGTFKVEANNNFTQLMPVFAFAMIAVGFGAPGAMSQNLAVSSVSLFFSFLFLIIGIGLILIQFPIALYSVYKQGIAKESSPSVWMLIPIFTLIGITGVRVTSGIAHNLLGIKPNPVIFFVALGTLVSLQIFVGLLGNSVLKNVNYFSDFVNGKEKSAGSYGLICPGVAFFVLGMFFTHWGLVQTGILTKFSIPYFVILMPFVFIQLKTINVLFKLNKKHFLVSNEALEQKLQKKAAYQK